jgi:hypothetical protein
MPLDSDGMVDVVTPLTAALLKELEDRGRRGRSKPLFPVRTRRCGCWLANVWHLPPVGDLLLGGRRALVQSAPNKASARHQQVAFALEDTGVDHLVSALTCKHSTLLTVSLAELRAAVVATARGDRKPGAPYLL